MDISTPLEDSTDNRRRLLQRDMTLWHRDGRLGKIVVGPNENQLTDSAEHVDREVGAASCARGGATSRARTHSLRRGFLNPASLLEQISKVSLMSRIKALRWRSFLLITSNLRWRNELSHKYIILLFFEYHTVKCTNLQ